MRSLMPVAITRPAPEASSPEKKIRSVVPRPDEALKRPLTSARSAEQKRWIV